MHARAMITMDRATKVNPGPHNNQLTLPGVRAGTSQTLRCRNQPRGGRRCLPVVCRGWCRHQDLAGEAWIANENLASTPSAVAASCGQYSISYCGLKCRRPGSST